MKSPGHQKWPDHKIKETDLSGRAEIEVNGEVIASSAGVIRVVEEGSPARLYFPRTQIIMQKLEPSNTTTECPFKGTARYFHLKANGGRTLPDAVWSYEAPFEEHQALKGRLAFYTEKFPEIRVRAPN